jgi:hypothetical protein
MRYIYFALTALLLSACVSNSQDLRPSVSETIDNSNDVQLSDNTMRFVSDSLTMAWDNGGIAFERLANGSIHGINLSTGDSFIFDPGKRDEQTAALTNSALWVNGVRVGYDTAQIIGDKDNVIWYKLSNTVSDYYVVIDTVRLPEL